MIANWRYSRLMLRQGKRAVLLVEDDNLDVGLFAEAFHAIDSPFSLISVRDGEEAIKYLAGEEEYADREQFPEPTVILLDINILRLDGFDVLRWLHERRDGKATPHAIVMSGSEKESDKQLARSLGAREYVVKFHDHEKLTDWIRGLEAKVKTWSAAAQRP